MPTLLFPPPSTVTIPNRHTTLLATAHAELDAIATEDPDMLDVPAEFVHGYLQRLRDEREALKRTP